MSPLKIRLLGKFSLVHNDREFECLPSAKAKELFCYLMLHRERAHSREVLASLLWGDCTTALSRKYFRQTLWQLQEALHSGQVRLLRLDGEYVGLDSEREFWLDVAVLEKAFLPVRGISGEQMEDQQAQFLRAAVSLYSGDLLEGWFQDWCLYHRERLQSMYLAMLDKLMGFCEFQREYENGLSFGERLLCKDNARERTHFRLMRLYYLSGDRAAALRQFDRCAAALEAELGVKPGRRTMELYEQIKSDQLKMPALAEAKVEERHDGTLPVPSFFPRLRRLRSLLLNLQHRLERDIHEVDRALATRISKPRSGRH